MLALQHPLETCFLYFVTVLGPRRLLTVAVKVAHAIREEKKQHPCETPNYMLYIPFLIIHQDLDSPLATQPGAGGGSWEQGGIVILG